MKQTGEQQITNAANQVRPVEEAFELLVYFSCCCCCYSVCVCRFEQLKFAY